MRYGKLTAGAASLSVAAVGAIGVVGSAGAATSASSKMVVKEKTSFKFVPNRYVQDGQRFDKDVYKVKSGGTVVFKMTVPQEGPHTLTVLAAKDVPSTPKKFANCKVCNRLIKAHGADPNSNAPPKFNFLENGVGQNTPPNLDRPGDSGVIFPTKGYSVSFKVTAKRGTTLHFICLVHTWMQAKLEVQ